MLFNHFLPFPVTITNLQRYMVFISRSCQSFQTVRNYIDGLRFYHVLLGYNFDQLYCNFQVQLLLKGLKRRMSSHVNRKLPITLDILQKIHTCLDLQTNKLHITLWAAFLVAFFGFLRKSNMVPQTASTFDTKKHLNRASFITTTTGITVQLRWTKTIQFNQSIIEIPLPTIAGSPFCPVTAINNMITKIKAPLSSPAFVVPHNDSLYTLTYSSYTNFLRELLQRCDLNGTLYSGHSFRSGGLQTAATCHELNYSDLMTHGTWSSGAIQNYLDKSSIVRAKVGLALKRRILQDF